MPREWKLFLDGMIQAAQSAVDYCQGCSEEELGCDSLRLLAVTKLLENLGEAAKHIPPNVKTLAPTIPWKRLTGMRDVLLHEYFDLHKPILIDVTLHKLPGLLEDLQRLQEELSLRSD